MKNLFKVGTIVLVSIVMVGMTSCFGDGDGGNNQNLNPSVVTTSKVVVKAALIDVLWGLTDDPNADAVCVANSTLTFGTDNPLMIKKNTEPTEYNEANIVVVGSIQIPLLDNATADRAPECGTEPVTFIVTASDLAPVDIVSSETSTTRQSLESKAKVNPTPYPTGCHVKAHFEKSGSALEVDEDVEDEDEGEENGEEGESTEEDEGISENESLAMNEDIDVDVDNEADEDSEDDTEEETDEEDEDAEDDEDEDGDETSEEDSEESEEEDATPIYSLKLVIDSYDCSQQQPSILVPRRNPQYNDPSTVPYDPHAPKQANPNAPATPTYQNQQ